MSRGYLALDELTKERFVENPAEPGQRMYRTGDIGRWQRDKTIEFLGRIDGQVKIRGNRVELGEIESAIIDADSTIGEAVVVARSFESELGLVAYCLSKDELDVPALRATLKSRLPSYMTPSFFVRMDSFPRTSSGKIDRKALPSPDGALSTGVEYVAPRTELEQKLVGIWQEILGVSKIGVKEEFFDLGGHSLKAVLLLKRLETEFQVSIPLLVIMNGSVESLAVKLSEALAERAPKPSKRGLGRALGNLVGITRAD